MTKEINITTRKQLDIYMNPQRQRLLKCMDVKAVPMTPKQLSVLLDISPSSVTYHLKKLQELGLVELDHTEMIHGICAKFYKRIRANVNLRGALQDDLKAEKEVLVDYLINDTYTGFKQYMNQLNLKPEDMPDELLGDARTGILYITEEEAKELKQFLQDFEANHSTPKENAIPWEVALIAYPKEEI